MGFPFSSQIQRLLPVFYDGAVLIASAELRNRFIAEK